MKKFFLCCLFSLLLLSCPVMAEDDPPFPPPDLRFLGWDYFDSTSLCIGKPETPACAVETYEACRKWWKQDVCDTVDFKLPPGGGGTPSVPLFLMKRLYQLVAQRRLTSGDIPRVYAETWRAGDMMVFVAYQVCSPREECYTALKDREDKLEQMKCPAVECDSNGDVWTNGRHRPSLFIVRETRPRHWSFIAELNGNDQFDRETDRLMEEGLLKAPW